MPPLGHSVPTISFESSTMEPSSESSTNPGWKPAGRAVLVKTYQREQLSKVIAMPEGFEANMAALEQRAVVVAVGPTAWHDEPQPRASVGDHVLVTKFAGFILTGDDGVTYRVINDRDIFARRSA